MAQLAEGRAEVTYQFSSQASQGWRAGSRRRLRTPQWVSDLALVAARDPCDPFVVSPRIVTSNALLDELLTGHAAALGDDFVPYQNHAYRVLNLCAALSEDAARELDKLAIAVAFHDLGIWTAGTFDYLVPSVELARGYLRGGGREAWVAEIECAILEHHKLTRYTAGGGALIEPFRRADWVDVSLGVLRFGLPRAFVRELYTALPAAGFHARLAELTASRTLRHPLSPLPMLRW